MEDLLHDRFANAGRFFQLENIAVNESYLDAKVFTILSFHLKNVLLYNCSMGSCTKTTCI